MPPKRRKQADEEVEEQVEEQGTDEEPQEEEVEDALDQVEEQTGSRLNLDISEDEVHIQMARDGNERKTLEALAKMLDALIN